MTINKTNLQKRLSKIAFEVTQKGKTEGPFSGKYFNFFEKGHLSLIASYLMEPGCCPEER